MTAYLFDFNGVLVDDERVHFAAFRDVLAMHGVPLDERTYFERYLAYDDATAFRAMLADGGKPVGPEVIEACVREKTPRYMRAITQELVVFPGGFELLRACAARGPVAIVSGALLHEIEFALDKTGSRAAVKTIVAADLGHASKPDPAGYVEGLRRLAVRASEGVAIEDSIAGVEAAVGAGCVVVAVGHSCPVDALFRAGARRTFARIAEITVDHLDDARARG